MQRTVGPRDRCNECRRSFGDDPFPELLLFTYDHHGFKNEYQREMPMNCTACQLKTTEGTLDLLAAVRKMPEDMFYPNIIRDLVTELGMANKLAALFRGSVMMQFVRLLHRWRLFVNLKHVFDDVTITTRRHHFTVGVMRRLAQYALERLDEDLKGFGRDGIEQEPNYLNLVYATTSLESDVELDDFFTHLEDLYAKAAYNYDMNYQYMEE
ncbi:Sodium- and chloride-dependent GABA transporter 1 [Hypoxylon texense]